MAGNNPPNELEVRMQILDGILPPPTERAKRIFARLETTGHVDPWDIICFATEVLSMNAAVNEALVPHIKPLNKTVYTLHYLFPYQYGIANDEQWRRYQEQLALRKFDASTFKGTALFGETAGAQRQPAPDISNG